MRNGSLWREVVFEKEVFFHEFDFGTSDLEFWGLEIKHLKSAQLCVSDKGVFSFIIISQLRRQMNSSLLFWDTPTSIHVCWDTPTVKTSLWQLPIVSIIESCLYSDNYYCLNIDNSKFTLETGCPRLVILASGQ